MLRHIEKQVTDVTADLGLAQDPPYFHAFACWKVSTMVSASPHPAKVGVARFPYWNCISLMPQSAARITGHVRALNVTPGIVCKTQRHTQTSMFLFAGCIICCVN